jgi:hypothetical protein
LGVGNVVFLPHLTPYLHPSSVFTLPASPDSLILELWGLLGPE